MFFNAIANRPMVTCSPVASTTSISRGSGDSCISCASATKRLVSPLMADTTTTTSCPSSRARFTRLATFLMRSGEPTDVPPYFCTIKAIVRSCLKLLRTDAAWACRRRKGADYRLYREFVKVCNDIFRQPENVPHEKAALNSGGISKIPAGSTTPTLQNNKPLSRQSPHILPHKAWRNAKTPLPAPAVRTRRRQWQWIAAK